MDELLAQYLFFAMVLVWGLTIYCLTYEYISDMFRLKSLKSKMCKSEADHDGTKKLDNTSWDNYEGEEIQIKALTFGMIQPLLHPSYGRMCPAAPRFKQPTSPTDIISGSVLEQCDEAVEVPEINEPPAITVTVAKTVFQHHMSDQGVARSHLGIRITNHDCNITFRKLPLNHVNCS